MTRARILLLSAGLLLLGALLRWPARDLPLDRDEGEFASLAWLWSSGHGVPYRDYLEQKPPATLGMHSLAQAFSENGVRDLRRLSQFWVALTVLALGLWLLRRGRDEHVAWDWERGAWAAGLLAALLLSSSRTQSLSANTESWLSLPVLMSVALALDGRWLLSGLALGLASLFKQPLLAGLLFLPWAAQPGEGRLLRTVLRCGIGAVLAWAAAAACFSSDGAVGALLNCTWTYNQGYVASGLNGAAGRAYGLTRWLLPELGGAGLLAALGWTALGPGRLRRALGAWLGLGLVLLAAGGRYYPHYAIGLLAPLALLAGAAWAAPLRGGAALLRGTASMAALLGWLYANGATWTARDGAARSYQVYGIEHFAAAPEAAAKLQAVCPPEKPVFLWGDEAQLYYLARRVPASRFLFSYPFTGEAPPWPEQAAELRAAVSRPDLGAVVQAKVFDANDPLQMEVQDLMIQRFDVAATVRPYLIGKPKP